MYRVINRLMEHDLTTIRISGPRACFTNPQHNADKYSYDIPTVSSLRQIIGAVYAKPEIRHIIKEIQVLNPIKRESVMVNGVSVLSNNNRGPSANQYLTTFLTDVDYRVVFDTQILDGSEKWKHREMFERRLERGAQYKQPYLGMRDMIARVEFDYNNKPPIQESEDFGWMLFDMVHPTDYHEIKELKRTFAKLKMVNGVVNTSNVEVRVM